MGAGLGTAGQVIEFWQAESDPYPPFAHSRFCSGEYYVTYGSTVAVVSVMYSSEIDLRTVTTRSASFLLGGKKDAFGSTKIMPAERFSNRMKDQTQQNVTEKAIQFSYDCPDFCSHGVIQ